MSSARPSRWANTEDLRREAARRLPPFLFEYIDGGSFQETTLRRNRQALEATALRQRVLSGVDQVDLSRTLFGRRWSLPVGLGPVGLAGLYARRGEGQAARAAEAAGVPFCLSTVSACSVEEVARAVTRPFWFQLYMIRDRGFMAELLQRVAAAGCTTLVFTVDMPIPGIRYRDQKSGLSQASGLAGTLRRTGQALRRPGWAWQVGVRGRPHGLGNIAPVLKGKSGIEDFLRWMKDNFDPTVTWADLAFVRAQWPGELVVKGVLDVEDAEAAAGAGADGVVVSNHGGRQLDGVSATAEALPAISETLRGRVAVLADGGVRSGLDVVRMLALGADGVLLGRAWAFALAAGGEAGVRRLLDILEAEMRVAMTLLGASDIAALGPASLHPPGDRRGYLV